MTTPPTVAALPSTEAPREWTDGFASPIDRFQNLYIRARQTEPFDHTAVTLATANAQGVPSARIVLLKGVDEQGFLIVTNYEGRKSQEMLANPHAALCFYYPTLNEQVRVEGRVQKATDEESDAYFASRPRTSQLGAWASSQSRGLDSRVTLQEAVEHYDNLYSGQAVPRPPHWGGFRIIPGAIEFWRDGAFRLHDRFLYQRQSDGTWTVIRLYP